MGAPPDTHRILGVIGEFSAKKSPPCGHGPATGPGRSSGLRWSSRRAEVVPSPNIWYYQADYELENHAQDSGGEIWRLLRE